MFKDVLRAMDFTVLSQIALVLFFLVFVAVVIRTWRRSDKEMDRQAQIPLSDQPIEPRNSDQQVRSSHE